MVDPVVKWALFSCVNVHLNGVAEDVKATLATTAIPILNVKMVAHV